MTTPTRPPGTTPSAVVSVPEVGNLTRLSWTLIGMFPSLGDARALAERAALNTGNIDLGGPPRVYMWNIVQEASKTGALDRVIDAAAMRRSS